MVRIHHPRAVREAVPSQEVGGPEVHVARGRAIADGADPEDAIQRIEAPGEVTLLGRLVRTPHALMHVPVVADLVTGIADRADDIGPGLGDPARDEERGPELAPVEHP